MIKIEGLCALMQITLSHECFCWECRGGRMYTTQQLMEVIYWSTAYQTLPLFVFEDVIIELS